MVLEITNQAITWNPKNQTFSAELSSLGRRDVSNCCFEGRPINVKNPITGAMVQMNRLKVDTDGEDVYGFWYHGSKDNRYFKFLFIND